MLKRIPPENTQDIEDLKVIIDQTERYAKIIRELLGFSRREASESDRVNTNVINRKYIVNG